MTVRLAHRTPKVEADEIANANYEALKEPVLKSVRGKLFGGGPRLNETDLDEAYLLGWHALTEYIVHGNKVKNLTGFLVNATYLRARDIARQLHEDRYVDADLEAHGVEDDLAERVDDGIKLDRLMDRLKHRLTDMERKAVTLCVLHGVKRPEAAQVLEVSENRIQRVMDSAMKKISDVVAGIDTRGCGGEEWAAVLRAYALYTLTEADRDYPRVKKHLEGCSTCERYVTGLRRVALILPPFGLPVSLGHEASILAHLYRVLGGGHSTVTVAQATAGSAGSAAAGGGGMAGVLGGGAAMKTAAVVAVAALGVATVHVVANDHTPSRHPRPAASSTLSRPEAVAGPSAVVPPASHAASGTSQSARRRHAGRHDKLPRSLSRAEVPEAEFGFEGSRTATTSTPAPAPATAVESRKAPRTPAPSSEAGHPSEFGFEQ